MSERSRAKTMRDVDHTPPAGYSVTNVWHRGRAGEAETAD